MRPERTALLHGGPLAGTEEPMPFASKRVVDTVKGLVYELHDIDEATNTWHYTFTGSNKAHSELPQPPEGQADTSVHEQDADGVWHYVGRWRHGKWTAA